MVASFYFASPPPIGHCLLTFYAIAHDLLSLLIWLLYKFINSWTSSQLYKYYKGFEVYKATVKFYKVMNFVTTVYTLKDFAFFEATV